MSWSWRRPKNSESADLVKVEKLVDLCKQSVLGIESLVLGGNLLNQRQCSHLSTKLADITNNIRALLLDSRKSGAQDRSSSLSSNAKCFVAAPLENLYRCLEKTKLLVQDCARKEWWLAAVFQSHIQSASQDILLEVWLCYIAIYEEAKRTSAHWTVDAEDLRKSSLFSPVPESDVLLDQQELQTRLEDLASVKVWNHFRAGRGDLALKHCLGKYLLGKLKYLSAQSQASTSNASSAILWEKESEPPETWGKSSFLGAGAGTSGVYKTEWFGIPCARKEFHGEGTEAFFLKEANILAHMRHPHVISFFCCGNGQKKGEHFIAMELMEKSLSKLIEDQKGTQFSIPVAVDIIVQIARGMCYLHDQNIAHRDLKPQNVVVNWLSTPHVEDRYCVKLVDFGMSKTKVEMHKSNTMTTLGIGTTMYRAPEVHPKAYPDGISARRKAIWLKADVFSFAMTCAHILSLKRPFEHTLANQLYNELLQGSRPELPENYPKELLELIKDCWNTSPRSRPSFLDIWIRLEKIRHKIMRGFYNPSHHWEAGKIYLSQSYTLIQMKLEEQSSFQKPPIVIIDDEAKDKTNHVVPLISCACGHGLESHKHDSFVCSICSKDTYNEDEVYHCEMCQFDAHSDCVEIKNDVKVFFHDDPLHLLEEHYYEHNADATCSFCWESLQDTKWMYRCDECDYDVHALCTKYPKKVTWHNVHPHSLILKSSPPRKNAFCKSCNGFLQGYWYSCIQKPCEFDLHPFCSILPQKPLCIFSNLSQHRLSLITWEKHFICNKCGGEGFSWYYYCEFCNLRIHLDCLDSIKEEESDFTEVYEKIMLEDGTIDDLTKMDTIIKLLDTLFVNDTSKALKASASSSRPSQEVATKVHPKIQTGISTLNKVDDESLRKKIATDIVERKAKKMEGKAKRKEARQISKANLFEMLCNLEKFIMDLQSCKNISQVEAKVLESTLEKIKMKQDFVFNEITTITPSQLNIDRGPQVCLFYQKKNNIKTLLRSLEADMEEVHMLLLCEEPGQEHIVPQGAGGILLGDEILAKCSEKLQPLLPIGLQVVMRAMSTLVSKLPSLKHVTLPILGGNEYNMSTLHYDIVRYGLRSIKPVLNNLGAQNRVESSAGYNFLNHDGVSISNSKDDSEEKMKLQKEATEWLLIYLEDNRLDIFEIFGLSRICYTETEKSKFPKYTQGRVAWLCTEHVINGAKASKFV